MVLHLGGCGRVGHRRNTAQKKKGEGREHCAPRPLPHFFLPPHTQAHTPNTRRTRQTHTERKQATSTRQHTSRRTRSDHTETHAQTRARRRSSRRPPSMMRGDGECLLVALSSPSSAYRTVTDPLLREPFGGDSSSRAFFESRGSAPLVLNLLHAGLQHSGRGFGRCRRGLAHLGSKRRADLNTSGLQ